MNREEAIEYWEGLRKTFSGQLEQEENHFGRMHLQTTIDALDMAISALRQQDHFRETTKMVESLTNAQKIRAMSDEELAEFLSKTFCNGYGGPKLIEWLQMPAEEDGKDDHES